MIAGTTTVVGGRYTVMSAALAAGAHGAVYKARDATTGEFVALRVLGGVALDSDVQVACDLGAHPGIVAVRDRGINAQSGVQYVVSEWMDGGTLRKLLADSGRLGWQDVADLGNQLAAALDYAHRHGVRAHRHVKPESIFRTRDGLQYRLGDFEVAGAGTDRTAVHAASAAAIRRGYAAPEESRGAREVDARADQFALGVVLFEALAGNGTRPLVRRASATAIRGPAETSTSSADELRTLAPDAPNALIRIIERAIRFDPQDRYDSCGAMAGELRAVIEPLVTAERTDELPAPRTRWSARATAGLCAAVVLAAAVYVAGYLLDAAGTQPHMELARRDGQNLQAAALVPTLWSKAETFRPTDGYAERTLLYNAARDAAWTVRLRRVADAEREAVDFDAGGEESFRNATAARSAAQQQKAADRLADAANSLNTAEDGFRAALSARRSQWAGQIRHDLVAQLQSLPLGADGPDVDELKARQNRLLRTLDDAEASADDLRRAGQAVVDLRPTVLAVGARFATTNTARSSANEALTAAEQAQRAALPWADASPRAQAAHDHAAAVLAAARAALEKDVRRAVQLANDAASRFKAVPQVALAEGTVLRRAALDALRKAEHAHAGGNAEALYAAGQAALRAADAASADTAAGLKARSMAYRDAQRQFDAARQLASRRALGAPAAHADAPPVPAAREIPVAAAKPREAVSGDLIRLLQQWMSEQCENVNRQLRDKQSGRARCEDVSIIDHQDVSKIRVSYVLTVGAAAGERVVWQTPVVHRPVLDCRSDGCRCLAGSDC